MHICPRNEHTVEYFWNRFTYLLFTLMQPLCGIQDYTCPRKLRQILTVDSKKLKVQGVWKLL